MTKQTRALQMAINALTNCSGFEEAIQACKEALAEQPTQAPMTHVIGIDNDGKEVVVKLQSPLYTHPKQWQGLSDDEIIPMYNEPSSDAEMIEFARAIEAKLREKNDET